jgi:hypothetical protein
VVKSTRVEEGQEGRVLLLPYVRENYGSISRTCLPTIMVFFSTFSLFVLTPYDCAVSLALWDTPTRGTHNHSLVLRYKKNT